MKNTNSMELYGTTFKLNVIKFVTADYEKIRILCVVLDFTP